MKTVIVFVLALVVIYVLVTHGSATGTAASNLGNVLANFISTKPMANVVTTKSAWSGVV